MEVKFWHVLLGVIGILAIMPILVAPIMAALTWFGWPAALATFVVVESAFVRGLLRLADWAA